eukprot:scaffold62063_cov65-Phaeocystis_antarctica.AAC.5
MQQARSGARPSWAPNESSRRYGRGGRWDAMAGRWRACPAAAAVAVVAAVRGSRREAGLRPEAASSTLQSRCEARGWETQSQNRALCRSQGS